MPKVNGQAGEIEITEEMLKAGAFAYEHFYEDYHPYSSFEPLVAEIYKAMELSKLSSQKTT